jgi:hypothetical protein
LRLLVPLAALLVAALVAGAALARNEVQAYEDAGRTERLALALRATVEAYAAVHEEFGASEMDGAVDFAAERSATDQRVAEMFDALGDADGTDVLAVDVETLEGRAQELPNARGVVDRLARNGREFLQSEAGSKQLQSATEPLLTSFEAVADRLAAELLAQPWSGAGAPARPAAELVGAARDLGLLRNQSARAFRAGLRPAELVFVAGASRGFSMGLHAAVLVAPADQRSALLGVENDMDQFKRWTDDFPGLLTTNVVPTAEGATQAQEWLQFVDTLFRRVVGVIAQFLTDTVADARQARSDAQRNLAILGAVALAVLLLCLVPFVPWRRLARRRAAEPVDDAAEVAESRVPVGVP